MARIPQQTYRMHPRLPEELRWSNYALQFGGGSYVLVPHAASLATPNAAAAELWMKLLGVPVDVQDIFTKRTTTNKILIRRAVTNLITGFLWTGAGAVTVSTPAALTVGRFYHILLQWDGADVSLYVNNVYIGGGPLGGNMTVDDNSIHLGSSHVITYQFNGVINEVRHLPVALNAEERRRTFQRGYARRELNARLVLRMEDRVGLTAVDDSGYGNNGSLLPVLTPPTWINVQKYQLLSEARV